jgi:hypothetical protein
LRIDLQGLRGNLILNQSCVRLESSLNSQINSRLIKFNNPSITFDYLKLFAFKWVKGGHPQLAIELLINHIFLPSFAVAIPLLSLLDKTS